ncbi:DegT/DnrJ/EryC1/StrS family aminotransferase [bacterium]|nr:DegT/DnrJ/EryC1/StrS family aminotransferase [bacterium]MCI0604645.1 DegT/DnrJ/EryC1/StrS family aminotransferase [bacterium]
MKIPITRPFFDSAEENAVIEVLRSGWVSQGKKVADFEKRVANFVGRKYAVAVSSCTAALHVAALAAGFGPGVEVVVPAFTWISTVNAVESTGATPVFCDIDPFTFNIDPASARARITSKTRGIIPVHLFGLAAEMSALMDLSEEVLVIEDAACALGSYYKNEHVGRFGQIGCFSFHPRKSITTGEGGMLVTDNENYYRSFLQFRNIGSDGASVSPDFTVLGYNYRMTDLQAAIGLTQFQKLPSVLQMRKACAKNYDDLIGNSSLHDWLESPSASQSSVHSYQSYVCKIKTDTHHIESLRSLSDRRNKLIHALASDGIETRPGAHAPYLLSYYKKYGFKVQDYPNALEADWLTIALPIFPQLLREDQEWICSRLQAAWQQI